MDKTDWSGVPVAITTPFDERDQLDERFLAEHVTVADRQWLHRHVVPKFVQLIKLVQAELGKGSETVRAPRLPLEGPEREDALRIIRVAVAARPRISDAA